MTKIANPEERCGRCGHPRHKHHHGLGMCEQDGGGSGFSCHCRRFKKTKEKKEAVMHADEPTKNFLQNNYLRIIPESFRFTGRTQADPQTPEEWAYITKNSAAPEIKTATLAGRNLEDWIAHLHWAFNMADPGEDLPFGMLLISSRPPNPKEIEIAEQLGREMLAGLESQKHRCDACGKEFAQDGPRPCEKGGYCKGAVPNGPHILTAADGSQARCAGNPDQCRWCAEGKEPSNPEEIANVTDEQAIARYTEILCDRIESRRELTSTGAETEQMTKVPEPIAQWGDPRVAKVYEILCDDIAPNNPEQHQEGFDARRIVDALFSQQTPAQEQPDLLTRMPQFCRDFAAHWREHPNAQTMTQGEMRGADVALMCFSNYLIALLQGLVPDPNILPHWFERDTQAQGTVTDGGQARFLLKAAYEQQIANLRAERDEALRESANHKRDSHTNWEAGMAQMKRAETAEASRDAYRAALEKLYKAFLRAWPDEDNGMMPDGVVHNARWACEEALAVLTLGPAANSTLPASGKDEGQ